METNNTNLQLMPLILRSSDCGFIHNNLLFFILFLIPSFFFHSFSLVSVTLVGYHFLSYPTCLHLKACCCCLFEFGSIYFMGNIYTKHDDINYMASMLMMHVSFKSMDTRIQIYFYGNVCPNIQINQYIYKIL